MIIYLCTSFACCYVDGTTWSYECNLGYPAIFLHKYVLPVDVPVYALTDIANGMIG